MNNGRCSVSSIPLRRANLNRTNSNSSSLPPVSSRIPVNNSDGQKWKQKYEDVEQKRKTIFSEKQKCKFNTLTQKLIHIWRIMKVKD